MLIRIMKIMVKKRSIKRGNSGTGTEGGVHELYVQTGAVFICEDNKLL